MGIILFPYSIMPWWALSTGAFDVNKLCPAGGNLADLILQDSNIKVSLLQKQNSMQYGRSVAAVI